MSETAATGTPTLTAAQAAILKRAQAGADRCYRVDNPMTFGVAQSLERAGLGIIIGQTFQANAAE